MSSTSTRRTIPWTGQAPRGNDKRVVVTTIRKSRPWCGSWRRKKYQQDAGKIRDLRVAFVVDECHQAVTPQAQRRSKAYFKNSLWYGFTGTPIFKEISASKWEIQAQTTHQQYGDRLHEYTVKEAIHDRRFLGFKVDYTIPLFSLLEEEIPDQAWGQRAHARSPRHHPQ